MGLDVEKKVAHSATLRTRGCKHQRWKWDFSYSEAQANDKGWTDEDWRTFQIKGRRRNKKGA